MAASLLMTPVRAPSSRPSSELDADGLESVRSRAPTAMGHRHGHDHAAQMRGFAEAARMEGAAGGAANGVAAAGKAAATKELIFPPPRPDEEVDAAARKYGGGADHKDEDVEAAKRKPHKRGGQKHRSHGGADRGRRGGVAASA